MELCSILGPNDVACISQDDKAKVPLGLPAANKQSTILMNTEYRVKLPDHDFVIAAGHKLTPSVMAGLYVEPNKICDAVSTSGPTYIAIKVASMTRQLLQHTQLTCATCIVMLTNSKVCYIEKMELSNPF